MIDFDVSAGMCPGDDSYESNGEHCSHWWDCERACCQCGYDGGDCS